jgi:hypothetical protein
LFGENVKHRQHLTVVAPWLKTSVREFGAHDGFCPATSTVGDMLPSAGITQMSKSPACA